MEWQYIKSIPIGNRAINKEKKISSQVRVQAFGAPNVLV